MMRKLTLLLLFFVAAGVAAAGARADGDPASDYLLSQQTFVSPNARVSSSDNAQLNVLITAARRRGYTIRVAVIQSRYDLGAVTALDKKPRLYAHFLSQELRLAYNKRLLVVMPNGYGIADNGKAAPTEQAVLDRLSPAGTLDGSALVDAAAAAVRALTLRAGVPSADLPGGAKRASGATASRDVVIIAAVAFLLLVAGGLIYVRRAQYSATVRSNSTTSTGFER